MKVLLDKLRRGCVLPVIEIEDAADAAPLAAALARGGLGAIEFTLRTEAAFAALAEAKSALPDLMIGMGTVLDPEGALKSIEAGADFLVTPGATEGLLAWLSKSETPFLPGVATPSEAMRARACGAQLLKFFPAEPAGGVAYLKALGGPLSDLLFCPTGSITPNLAPSYLALANVVCVGGSWVTPKDAIRRKDWGAIEANARRAVSLRAP